MKPVSMLLFFFGFFCAILLLNIGWVCIYAILYINMCLFTSCSGQARRSYTDFWNYFSFFLHLNHCSQFSLSYCTYCSCTMYATKWQGYVGCHTFCSDLFHKVANRTASVKLEVVANKNNNAAYQTRRHTAIKWISWKYDPVMVNDYD